MSGFKALLAIGLLALITDHVLADTAINCNNRNAFDISNLANGEKVFLIRYYYLYL